MGFVIKSIGLCLAGLLMLLFTTQPVHLPTILLVVPYLLIFFCLLLAIVSFLRTRGRPANRSVQVGVLLAGLPVLLLAMRSLGQLALRDVVTLLVLFGVAYLYMTRMMRTE